MFGKQKGEALVGQVVFLLGLGEKGFVPFLEAQVGQFIGAEVGSNLLLEDLGPEVKPVDLRLEVKGQGVEKALARILELLLIGDDDLFVPLCGDWIDACLEDVALGPFEQPRVDSLADDALENLPTLGLFHHHALAQLAVDGHGKAGNGLSFSKREIEPSLEHAVEVVVEIHGHGGDREVGHHLHVDRQFVHAEGNVLVRSSSLDGFEHDLGPLGNCFQATVSGHGLGQTAFCFFFRYLDAGDFALVHQNGINHSLLQSAFAGGLEGDRPIVQYAGDFTLDLVDFRALDQNGREAGVLSVGKGGAERKNYSAEEKT